MSPWTIRRAESIRAWLTAALLNRGQRSHRGRPRRELPLPLMAWIWPRVGADAYGLLHWPSYRWPMNGARWCLPSLWPTQWDGCRHPVLQSIARIVWTLVAAVAGFAVLGVAAISTVVALAIYLLANTIGAGLIVFGGWIAPGPTPSIGRYQSLEDWAADVGPDLVEGPLDSHGARPGPARPPLPDEEGPGWNDRRDPILRAQIDATQAQRDLIAHQQELMAHDLRMQQLKALHPAGSSVVEGRRPRRRRRDVYVVDPVPRHALPIALARFVLLGSILLGSLFFGGALLLSALGGYVGVEPPTSDEIRTGINQRTTERMTDAEARFEELNQ